MGLETTFIVGHFQDRIVGLYKVTHFQGVWPYERHCRPLKNGQNVKVSFIFRTFSLLPSLFILS